MKPYLGSALTPLIGRERDLSTVESVIADGARIVTLLGPGGSGKTRLARELWGRQVAEGVNALFVDLVGVVDPGLVPTEIATELGVSETTEFDAAEAVMTALSRTSTVVFLDNLEELTDARDFLARALHAAPGLQLVATSRVPLRVSGEVEFRVLPLELPSGDTAVDVEASPAGALFLERARAAGWPEEVDPAAAQAIAQLCRRLDGLPLALEFAAARTRILPPESILRHLAGHTVGLLTTGDAPGSRHQSLDDVLTWSLDLLEPDAAEVLGAVAISPAGFDYPMAQALAPAKDIFRALDALASLGLLSGRRDLDGEPWYQLLETVRAAALQRSDPIAIDSAWQRLSAHVFERVSGTDEAHNRLEHGAFRQLDPLVDHVRAVLDWTETSDPDLNLRVAEQFSWYCLVRGRSREGAQRLRTAIAACPSLSPDLARAFDALASMERDLVQKTEPSPAAEAARIGRLVGDVEQEIAGLASVIGAADAPMSGEVSRLKALLGMTDRPLSLYHGMTALAWAEGIESGFDSEAVMSRFLEAQAAVAASPYRRYQGAAAGDLAQTYLYRNMPREAEIESGRALSILDEAGPEMLAWAHAVRATALASTGDIPGARNSLRLALDLADTQARGLPTEVLIAAIAVFSSSTMPLLAAKIWGAAEAPTFGAAPSGPDLKLVERLITRARKAVNPVAFELAIQTGRDAGVGAVMQEVSAQLDELAGPRMSEEIARLRHGTLTQREVEVLALIGAGKSDGEIATALFISPKTASVHVSNAKAKLGVDTRLEAALWARDAGLVTDEGQE